MQTPKVEAPKIILPEEPLEGDPDSLAIILRMPVTGERITRRFLKTDTIGLLFDFVDHLQGE